MTKQNWRGIFGIPMTPWTTHDTIDEEVLRKEIDFIATTCKGIVTPVLVSEFQALDESERRTMMKVPIEQAGRRVPVIVNVAGVSTPQAVAYARSAVEFGADGVIAMPPYTIKPDFEVIYSYFSAINAAVNIPIWIQNAGLVPMSTDQVIRLCSDLEHVKWVKEEVPPTPRSIGALCARKSPNVHGVMGGVGGLYLPTEHARGVDGCIIACEFCDIEQKLWDALEAGDTTGVNHWFDIVQPMIVLEGLMGMGFAKEIMVRRGIFKSNAMRMQTNPLLADDLREIDRQWERIKPFITL